MKLYYYKDKHGNFGDDLNAWLWPRLLPSIHNVHPDKVFVGIGTILNESLPKKPHKVIFGSGVGYGDVPPIDETWNIYGVRGPLTARSLGIDSGLAISDPALLIRTIWSTSFTKRYKVAFMPHHATASRAPWKTYCNALGIEYIDPAAAVENVVTTIGESEVVITEAMHGAIVADALRTPWIPVQISAKVLEFKWMDWLSTLNMTYRPVVLGRQHYVTRRDKAYAVAANSILTLKMRLLAGRVKPFLSREEDIDRVTDRLQSRVHDLRRDFFS